LPRLVRAVALVLVCLLVPVMPHAAAAPAPRVLVYGDSVVQSGALPIAATLERAGWWPTLVAYAGADLDHIAANLRAHPAVPDVVVIGAGYTYFWKPFVVRAEIDAVMRAAADRGVRRVIWLNTRETRAQRRDVNVALRAAAQRWGTLDVADWNGYSRGHDRAFASDGYHLRDAGGRLMGALVATRLAAYVSGAPRSRGPSYGDRRTLRPVVFSYGTPDAAEVAARAATIARRSPFVGLGPSPTGRGYWLAQRSGGVVARGDAPDLGGLPAARGRAPVVGIAAHRGRAGYWLATSDGGVYAFGAAPFRGSARTIRLRAPIVGIAATPSGGGYWLVASDGGVFTFGDARFYGSTGAMTLAQPIVGIAAHPSGRGYWLAAYDGGVFAFGAAHFHGSAATAYRYWKIEGIAPTRTGNGYWLLDACGSALPYDAPSFTKIVGTYKQLFVAIAARPRRGYFVLGQG
jgi:hypothetical protein